MPIVLVIDDDELVRAAIEHALVRRGHDVIAASNGHDAMRRSSHCAPDVVITDIFMPECDGFELITLLRTRRPDIRIIAISAGQLRGLDALGVAGQLGAQVLLPKPFSEKQLLVALDQALAVPEPRPDGRTLELVKK